MHEQAINLLKRGRTREAIDLLRRTLNYRPQDPAAHVNLAIAYEDAGDVTLAERGYRFVLAAWPGHVEAASNLGNLLARLGRLSEAEAIHRDTLTRRPDDPYALTALALTQADQAKVDDCLANLKRAAELTRHPMAWSEYLSYGLHVGYDAEGHRQWAERFGGPMRQGPPVIPYDGKRQIRVGYVCTSWDRHSVSAFILPILDSHTDAVHVTLFSDINPPARIREAADDFVDTRGKNLLEFNTAVRGQRIDVLVDLDGHKHGSRLLCLAANPSPVCGTMNGYLPDTGLTENFNLGWAFRPHDDAPPVSPLPADRNGFVTFGSIHRACKITEPAARGWAAVLSAVPTGRLVVNAKGGEGNKSVQERLEAAGVPSERLSLTMPHAAAGDYLRAAGEMIDIHLDAWPFNGVTTTCDLLHQGVPTVTRRTGERQGQVGADLLAAVGLPDLVAQADEQFVRIAAALAADIDRLRTLRATLRDRMAPLLDGKPLARRLEALYRDRLAAPMQPSSPTRTGISWAAHGAAGIAKAVTGTGGADQQLIDRRTGICGGCDKAVIVAGVFRQCSICKCATWAKVRNKGEKCPLGKW